MEKQETTQTTAASPAQRAKQLRADNYKATAALSATLDPTLRDAAAKAAKVKPESVIGVRESDSAYHLVVATDVGVEKLEAPKKAG